MPKRKSKKEAKTRIKNGGEIITFLYIAGSIFIIILTMFNFQSISLGKKVLGASTEVDYSEVYDSKTYWEDLVSKYPTYYDGWMELYKINLILGDYQEADKSYNIAKRIDFNR